MIWKTFFRVFAERSPTPYFYNEISPSRGPSFHNFDSKMAKLHFWPKRGQWDTIGSQFDPICIKFDSDWVKFGPIYIHKLPINRPSGRYVTFTIDLQYSYNHTIAIATTITITLTLQYFTIAYDQTSATCVSTYSISKETAHT